MKTDLYTKSVMTVIAVALTVIAVRGFNPNPVIAQGRDCGSSYNPCYVTTEYPLDVNVKNEAEVLVKNKNIGVFVVNPDDIRRTPEE